MSCLGTQAASSVSIMSNRINPDFLVPLNTGMYEHHCTQTVPLAFIPCHPYWIYYLQIGTG